MDRGNMCGCIILSGLLRDYAVFNTKERKKHIKQMSEVKTAKTCSFFIFLLCLVTLI